MRLQLQPFPLRTLLSFSSSSPPLRSLSIFVSHFSTSQTHPLHSHHFSRRHEEVSRRVKVSVWWDFENCNLPADCNVFKIANTITAALRANGIMGPLEITAFGDILQLSRANQEALSSTGVKVSHVPNGGKNSADRTLLVDLMNWISQNPPPAHLFLISSDRDFASVLHRLRMDNYNILLASLESKTPSVLCSAASIMWDWGTLLKNEELAGKHYNQPPDGPYGSWYGHYKVPLEDPFLIEQSVCSPTDKSPRDSDPKPRPVPKVVTNQIRKVLRSCPKGISFVDLRSELTRLKVSLDKDFYGYKKISSFLLSMPHILWLQSQPDGQFIIHGITPKAGELSESSPGLSAGPVCKNGDRFVVSSRSSGVSLNGTSGLLHSPEVNAVVTPGKVQQTPPENDNLVKVNAEEPPVAVLQTLPVGKKIDEGSNDQVSESHGDSEGRSAKQNNYTLEKCTGVSSEKEGMKEELEEKSCEAASYPVTVPSSSNVSTTDSKASAEAGENHSGKSSGLFNRIASWCKFWRSSQESQSCEKHEQINIMSLKHEVFTHDSFWKDIEILMDSPEGSLLITESRTREEMAENLRKRGSLALRSLHNTDLLQLVNLLISDKKWIEEHPSQTSSFRISRAVEKSPDLGYSPLDANFHPKHEAAKKLSNIPYSGVSSTIINENSSGCSRYEILADCRKLAKEILKEHPEGYNMGRFRKLFQERYGYPLDLRRLGYKKLASLLEIMPGVKIVETYIFPASTFLDNSGLETAIPSIQENTRLALGKTASELPHASKTGDDFDSTWDELGAASSTSSNRKEVHPGLGSKRTKETNMTYPDSEAFLSDYEISDSGRKISTSERSQPQWNQRVDEENTLFEVLDSWYSRKNRKDTTAT